MQFVVRLDNGRASQCLHSLFETQFGSIARPMSNHKPSKISPATVALAHRTAETVNAQSGQNQTPLAKALELETLMMDGISVQVKPPWLGQIDAQESNEGLPSGRFLMGDDPRRSRLLGGRAD